MSSQRNNQLVPQADSQILTDGLRSLHETLFAAAEANIRDTLGTEIETYTSLQVRAMVTTEALRLTSGMDLSTIITRGSIIQQIEREGLAGVHPNGYANLTELSKDNGVSVGELSDIRAMHDVIFPYIANELRLNLMEIWEQIGKSSFRELVPALRSLITGQPADHGSVRSAVETMLNNAALSLAQELNCDTQQLNPAEVRQAAIQNLLQDGATLPTRQLRRRVRPTPVAPIEMATLQTGEGRWYGVMRFVSQEQRDLAMRVLNAHTNNMNLDVRSGEHSERRRLLGSFFGDNNGE